VYTDQLGRPYWKFGRKTILPNCTFMPQLSGSPGAESATPVARTIAYLVGHYPGTSIAFILREIIAIRQAGWRVLPTSVREPDVPGNGFTKIEREEADQTFYIKRRGYLRLLLDQLACFITRPVAYLRGAWKAIALAGTEPQQLAFYGFYFVEATALGRWLSQKQVKHLHVHFANAACAVAILVQEVYGISYSVSIHGPDEFYNIRHYRVREKVQGALFIRCISNFCRSQLMLVTSPPQWSKMEICRLGVDPEHFLPRPAPQNEVFTVLCLGRLVPAKGQVILLRSAAQLIEAGMRFHIFFVGDGPEAGTLKEEASRLGLESAVTFCGSANQDLLVSFWKQADIFVLPSFAEGVPVSLMEAMSMEIPCISTTVGGVPELIQTGSEGILVPPSDSIALTEAIQRLANDPRLREDLGRAARRKILRLYDLRRNTMQLADLFSQKLQTQPERVNGKSTPSDNVRSCSDS
jgi:colanic acid/amylovoran biosynthesis glycosyltransferase